jgi:hypothetical protein
MDLLAMLVELPLHGFHRRCTVPGQPRSANRKVFVATGALAVQPGFVVLGDLKMWLFHASSMAQSGFQFQIAKIRTAPLPKKGGEVSHYRMCELWLSNLGWVRCLLRTDHGKDSQHHVSTLFSRATMELVERNPITIPSRSNSGGHRQIGWHLFRHVW